MTTEELAKRLDNHNKLYWWTYHAEEYYMQQVHDMTGRSCGLCGHSFTTSSMNLTVSVKREGYIEKLRVCGKCHNLHHMKGE